MAARPLWPRRFSLGWQARSPAAKGWAAGAAAIAAGLGARNGEPSRRPAAQHRQLLLAVLLCGPLLALVVLPLQGLAIAGYALERLWPHGQPGLEDPLLPVLVFCGTLTLLALAWGPLAAGRGSGALALEGLQDAGLPATRCERLLAVLGWRAQLQRLMLLALGHGAGLAVGIETPAASFGASTLLALRGRLAGLGGLPVPLLAAIGAGAGLGAAFRSPLLGVIYALECLGSSGGMSLVWPTLLLAGLASLLPLAPLLLAPLAGLAPLGLVPGLLPGLGQAGGLPLAPLLLPWALLLTLVVALVGAGLRRALLVLSPRIDRLLEQRFLPTALVLAVLAAVLAHRSGGISLNDGARDLTAALTGAAAVPRWAVLPRLLSPLLASASGAPGGLSFDCMSLGALVVAPLVRRLAADQQLILIALGAAVLFSAACRTPLLAAVFVVVVQRDGASLPLLLLASAIGAAVAGAFPDPPLAAGSGTLLHGVPLPAPAGRLDAASRLGDDRPAPGGINADRPSGGGD
ncbi:MAG: chloride channel protein [Cyanobium sp.]